jgi:hypothetical protein
MLDPLMLDLLDELGVIVADEESATNKTVWSSGMLSHGDLLPLTPTNGRGLHNYVNIFRVRLHWKDTEDGA